MKLASTVVHINATIPTWLLRAYCPNIYTVPSTDIPSHVELQNPDHLSLKSCNHILLLPMETPEFHHWKVPICQHTKMGI